MVAGVIRSAADVRKPRALPLTKSTLNTTPTRTYVDLPLPVKVRKVRSFAVVLAPRRWRGMSFSAENSTGSGGARTSTLPRIVMMPEDAPKSPSKFGSDATSGSPSPSTVVVPVRCDDAPKSTFKFGSDATSGSPSPSTVVVPVRCDDAPKSPSKFGSDATSGSPSPSTVVVPVRCDDAPKSPSKFGSDATSGSPSPSTVVVPVRCSEPCFLVPSPSLWLLLSFVNADTRRPFSGSLATGSAASKSFIRAESSTASWAKRRRSLLIHE